MINKNIVTTILFLMLFIITFSQKEYNKKIFLQQKNTISFSPFNLALSQGVITYERKFGNKNSFVFLNSFQMFKSRKNVALKNLNHFKFQTEIQYRRYLTHFQLRKNKFPETKNAFGAYVAPLLNYEYGEQHYNSIEDSFDSQSQINYSEDKFYNAVQGGLIAGVKFDILFGKLSIELNTGAAYKKSWVVHNKSHENIFNYRKMNSGIMAYGFSGFVPKVNFHIGYNF